MLPLSCMSWASALCSTPEYVGDDLAGDSAHSRGPDLLASDQTTVDSLPQRLADRVPLDSANLDQVKNRPQRASKLKALRGLYIAFGQVGIMKHEDARNIAAPPEIRRNGHVQLCRIQI